MSHAPIKKSVFDRIGGNSSSPSAVTNSTNKSVSTHGFCNTFIKTGSCPLGDTCKYIHEQPNFDKQSGSNDEFRITKTITRVVDMSSSSMKSTVTVSNEQRPVVVSNSIQSNRTVIESIAPSTDHSADRRSSGNDRKQSDSHHSTSKIRSSSNSTESSKKKSYSSSHEIRHSSSKKQRAVESESSVSSASDSEYTHSSRKQKKKSSSSKHKKRDSISPMNYDEEETLNDQLLRQTSSCNRSPKRTITIARRNKDEATKSTSKDSKSKSVPEIEFLGSKKIKPEKKPVETIHQQTESNKKSNEIKREKKSPSRSTSEQQRRHSSSTNTSSTSIYERSIQVKTDDAKSSSSKTQNSSERSDRNATELTPPVLVQLSPTPPIQVTSEMSDKGSVEHSAEAEKSHANQPSSPVCVILDDDSSPAPSIDKKDARQVLTKPVKKSSEPEKTSSKSSKRSRDVEKTHTKDKSSESSESKRKRLNDGSSKKVTSSNKSRDETRSTSSRSDPRRSATNTALRDESSSRKHKDKLEAKSSRSSDAKEHTSTKSRSNSTRHDTTRSSSEKKRSSHRHGKEKDLENITDSEGHLDESTVPKQTAIEAYMAMDWSSLSRDKRIPSNSQVTSRIARTTNSNDVLNVSDRLLTTEQKEKLQGVDIHSLPLTHFMKQLQLKSTPNIVNSCHRRFGSCAKDMIEMRHKLFTRSIEPVQRYEFINKEHYLAYQQAINSLLDKTPVDSSTVQVETTSTTTTDAMLS
ncbi:unnamed protein product [Adineta ricciae]|uniref:C3H1-type domain-containing protein n=1 Tax=Adineta ricciae TaxID=249248 RepID=A0A815L9T3_ADIRI|nr:unnamed protein product [Adineta ricciae]